MLELSDRDFVAVALKILPGAIVTLLKQVKDGKPQQRKQEDEPNESIRTEKQSLQ